MSKGKGQDVRQPIMSRRDRRQYRAFAWLDQLPLMPGDCWVSVVLSEERREINRLDEQWTSATLEYIRGQTSSYSQMLPDMITAAMSDPDAGVVRPLRWTDVDPTKVSFVSEWGETVKAVELR